MISAMAANDHAMRSATVLLLALWMYSGFAQEASLKLTHTIPMNGVRGRFDHFAIDAKGQRLFVAALGNNSLEVIDLAAGKRIQSVPGMSKPTGVLYVPEVKQVLVADGEVPSQLPDGSGRTESSAFHWLPKACPPRCARHGHRQACRGPRDFRRH